ncbi:hypothetical protein ACMGE9_10805 [Macrococcus sp. EM39E]|uniref:hypothetical protein n=1 Tax=Macrococcus animalis TaxID=3395467 RepID=UPI0039BDB293
MMKINSIPLNEDGYVTYPYEVLKHIEPYVKSLKWKINAQEHNGDFLYADFPFDHPSHQLMDGETLLRTLKEYSDVQWVWGVLSGFPNELSWEEIERDAVIYDVTEDLDIWKGGLSHIESKAIFEIIAMDSSETIVLIDEVTVMNELLKHFSNHEILE